MWNQQLVEKYNISGPRYTSYPTALQFEENFGQVDFNRAISALPQDQSISLYIHIPFCYSLCNYCACNKIVTKNRQRAVEYIDYLNLEIERMGKLAGEREVKQIHFGGGSPTYLSDQQMVQLINQLDSHFNLAKDSQEFAIEIDPRSLGENSLEVFKSVGFNRISIGVQDFNHDVQVAINRVQSEALTRGVIDNARQLGYQSVNVDLIYGLPHQTQESFAKTIDTIIDIRPDRISLFNYAHLPHRFKPQRRIVSDDLPCATEKLAIFKHSIEQLTNAGYLYIGMDHFALPSDELSKAQQNNCLQRNFQGYTPHEENTIIGLGVSAISHILGCYSQNQRDLYDYYEALEQGELAIWRGCYSDEDDLLRKTIIMELICHFQLDIAAIEQQFNLNFTQYFNAELTALKALEQDGLIKMANKRIEITPVGRLLVRNVCMVFDAYLGAIQVNSYSQAI